jgi:hypothetical protein
MRGRRELREMLERLEKVVREKRVIKSYRRRIKFFVVCWVLYYSGLSVRAIEDISEFLFGERISKSAVHRGIQAINKAIANSSEFDVLKKKCKGLFRERSTRRYSC